MIINNDSPLRRLPPLDPKTTLILDGIRYSIEMADAAYSKLHKTIFDKMCSKAEEISNTTKEQIKSKTKHVDNVSVFLDAWSVVDSVHRLRGLFKCAPFIVQDSGCQQFYQDTNDIQLLRNIVQHLPGKINEITSQYFPILGVLSWFYVSDLENKIGLNCSLLAGTLFNNMRIDFVNPSNSKRNLIYPLDLITLNAYKYSVCLTDIMMYVEKMTRIIENQMKEQFENLPAAGADLMLCAHLKWE